MKLINDKNSRWLTFTVDNESMIKKKVEGVSPVSEVNLDHRNVPSVREPVLLAPEQFSVFSPILVSFSHVKSDTSSGHCGLFFLLLNLRSCYLKFLPTHNRINVVNSNQKV